MPFSIMYDKYSKLILDSWWFLLKILHILFQNDSSIKFDSIIIILVIMAFFRYLISICVTNNKIIATIFVSFVLMNPLSICLLYLKLIVWICKIFATTTYFELIFVCIWNCILAQSIFFFTVQDIILASFSKLIFA